MWPFCTRVDPALERKLDQANLALANLMKEIKKMTQAADALNVKVDALGAKLDVMATAMAAIRQDISDIKAAVPPEGGMSADEVAALNSKLDGVTVKLDAAVANAQELDAENNLAPAPIQN
jgi:predicted  nucleic acid-binding Zn-ribbon protein